MVPATVSAPCEDARAGRLRSSAFGRRMFIALAIGLIWLGPAWQNPRFIWALGAWDVAVLVVWLIDWRRLPSAGEISVSRRWTSILAQGEPHEVELEITNASPVHLKVTLEDDVPSRLGGARPHFERWVRPLASERGTYSIRPLARGDARLGKAHLRVSSPLELAEKWFRASIEQTVCVYPGMPESGRSLYLVRGRQRELERKRPMRTGLGREFDSLREFRQGDEQRDICWTATARRAKLITKTYQAERSQSVFLVVDAGRLMQARILPPMGSSAPVQTKLDIAVSAALAIARVALNTGDTVGLLAYGRRIQARLAPARGPAQLRLLFERLAVVEGEAPEARHLRAAEWLLEKRGRRSLLVWLTDVAESAGTPEVIEAAARLLTHHLVLFAAIGQPDLDELARRRPASITAMYRHAAAVELTTRRELFLRRLRQQGAMAFELAPGNLASALVNQYLLVKERRLL